MQLKCFPENKTRSCHFFASKEALNLIFRGCLTHISGPPEPGLPGLDTYRTTAWLLLQLLAADHVTCCASPTTCSRRPYGALRWCCHSQQDVMWYVTPWCERQHWHGVSRGVLPQAAALAQCSAASCHEWWHQCDVTCDVLWVAASVPCTTGPPAMRGGTGTPHHTASCRERWHQCNVPHGILRVAASGHRRQYDNCQGVGGLPAAVKSRSQGKKFQRLGTLAEKDHLLDPDDILLWTESAMCPSCQTWWDGKWDWEGQSPK